MTARVELKPHVICDVHGSDIVATDAELAAELVRQHNEHDHPPTLVEVIALIWTLHDLTDEGTACKCRRATFSTDRRWKGYESHMVTELAKAIEARFTVVAR